MRAQEILKPLLLRRTKNAKLEGEPILKLPEKHIELKTMEFSEDERQVLLSPSLFFAMPSASL
jgi:SNF2 family DNA or RNA helicase